MGYLNEKLYLQAPGHLDWKLKLFSSKAVALAAMPYWQREIGQVVNVLEGDRAVRYWFEKGVLDTDLVLLDTITTDGTTITGTGTITDPVKSNVYNADETGANLPQRSKIQGGEYIEYTDDAVNLKTIVDIKPDKLEETTELESEVIELEQADEIETEILLNPDWEETDITKISFIKNKPQAGGSKWIIVDNIKSGYGMLYNMQTIWKCYSLGAKFIDGFYIPYNNDVNELILLVGGELSAGPILRSTRNINDCIEPAWSATQESQSIDSLNFSALPSGCIEIDGQTGSFINKDIGLKCNIMYIDKWFDQGTKMVNPAILTISTDNIVTRSNGWIDSRYGYSVRLVRDLSVDELLLPDGFKLPYVKDIDGNTYSVIKIGNKGWLGENLSCKNMLHVTMSYIIDIESWGSYSDAQCSYYAFNQETPGIKYTDEKWEVNGIKPINDEFVEAAYVKNINTIQPDYVQSDKLQPDFIKNKPLPIFINETEQYAKTGYGSLYNWYAVNESQYRGGFITGFRVPTSTEYEYLLNYAGGEDVAGIKLISKRAGGMIHPRWTRNTDAITDEYNYSILPAGQRDTSGMFSNQGTVSGQWTFTEYDSLYAIGVFYHEGILVGISNDKKTGGRSVRCVRDLTQEEAGWNFPDGTYLQVVEDYNGNKYETVKIGNYVWLAQNLRCVNYVDGTVIPIVTNATTWKNLTTHARCWYSNNQNAAGVVFTDEFVNNTAWLKTTIDRKLNEKYIFRNKFQELIVTNSVANWDYEFGQRKKIEITGDTSILISNIKESDTGLLTIVVTSITLHSKASINSD